MIFVKPSFYDSFSCLAGKCAHTCCVGWEIDIDDATRALYASLGGALGKELKENISDEPQPHFVLTEDERCPFLRKDGLCRIILSLGEAALCDICALHPRFFNSFPGREEAGLGLCCEEVVRLLLSSPEGLTLIEQDDGESYRREPWREELAALRAELLSDLNLSSLPFRTRLERVLSRLGVSCPTFVGREWKAFFLSLERMDESWKKMLQLLDRVGADELEKQLESPRYSAILAYLLYRHLIKADCPAEARGYVRFCAVGTLLIAALDAADASQMDEHVRAFSAEIEYSDENVEKICSNFL